MYIKSDWSHFILLCSFYVNINSKLNWYHYNIVGYCSGYYKAQRASWRASGKKYEAQIVIFHILLAVNRFSWISRKVESRWGKLESRWGKSESCWRKQKAIEENKEQLKKIEFCVRKIDFRIMKILIFPRDSSVFWQFWRLVSHMQRVACVRMDFV